MNKNSKVLLESTHTVLKEHKQRIPRVTSVFPSNSVVWGTLEKRKINIENGRIIINKSDNEINDLKLMNKLWLVHRWKVRDLKLRGNEITRKEVKDLGNYIVKNSLQSKRLDLEIYRGFARRNSGIAYIFPMIRDLTNLKQLKLDFRGCDKIRSQAIENLGKEIARNLPQLDKLDISFRACPYINETGPRILVKKITKYLDKLRELRLKFDGYHQINDKTAKILGVGIGKRLTQLQHLNLDFTECRQLTDDGVSFLVSKISESLTQLEGFHLNLNQCHQLTDGGFKALGSYIAKFRGLKYLSIEFHVSDQITDKGLEGFILNIAKNLLQLRQLVLRFDANAITNKSITILATEIGKYFHNLVYLDLSFLYGFGITDTSIEVLASQMQHLKNLELMYLNFSGCVEIKSKAAEALVLSIATNLTQLKALVLRLADIPTSVRDQCQKLVDHISFTYLSFNSC